MFRLSFILHVKVREVSATLPPRIGKLQMEAMYFDECRSHLNILSNRIQVEKVNGNNAVLIIIPYKSTFFVIERV